MENNAEQFVLHRDVAFYAENNRSRGRPLKLCICHCCQVTVLSFNVGFCTIGKSLQ